MAIIPFIGILLLGLSLGAWIGERFEVKNAKQKETERCIREAQKHHCYYCISVLKHKNCKGCTEQDEIRKKIEKGGVK